MSRGSRRSALGCAAAACAACGRIIAPLVLCLCVAGAGCARKPAAQAPPGSPGLPAGALSQTEIDKAIPPLSQQQVSDTARSAPGFVTFVDKVRAVYAALPAETKQQMVAKGEYAFHLSDLPPEQAQVMKDLAAQDENLGISDRDSLANLTFLFQHQGEHVALRFRMPGREINWASFGLWVSGK